ncbi:MAG: HEAT repeat domain-containing protein [Gammaproteobacteria bacterium]|nr:HEAT repeat domain-containing protein [Gammaproteobacteria bacterium]NNC58217.1 hypothetical protein [Woeseiaceae bacterium]
MSVLVIAKVTLIFALAWLALLCMRQVSASLRHVVVVVALSAALLVPLFEIVLPAWNVVPRPELSFAFESIEAPGSPAPSTATVSSVSTTPTSKSVTSGAGLTLRSVWFTGATILLLVLLVRILTMQFAARRAPVLQDQRWTGMLKDTCSALNICEPVQLRLRDEGAMPAVWGVRRPLILLPTDCLTWSDARCRDVLAHELAHVRRSDVLLLTLAHVVCALHWFHPLAWLLKRRLSMESEYACDDLALSQGVPAPRYADHLLRTATEFFEQHSLAPVMAAQSQLEGRIMAILETTKSRGRATIRAQLLVAALAAIALVPLSSMTWAQADNMWANVTEHAHQHSDSDSAQFATHLQEIGIAADDVDTLLTAIGAAEALTRAASAWALGASNDPRVVDPLMQAGYDNDAIVRQWAVRSLAPWNVLRVGRMLIDRLQDTDAEVRQWAVRSLNRHEASLKAQPLVNTLGDSDTEVREWAARGLADVDEPFVKTALTNRIAIESNADVSEWLVRALRGGKDQSVDALLSALNSESADVRQWAVRGLSGTQDGRAVDALIMMLVDNNAEVREWSVRGLGVCGNERAIGPLQAMSQDPSAEVREWAGRALEQIDC